MHLLVLSAFRRGLPWKLGRGRLRLNAPFGAQCFPTLQSVPFDSDNSGLNAPFGAQCFPTPFPHLYQLLLVWSQCTFWCSVLSDVRPPSRAQQGYRLNAPFGAQCFPTRQGARCRRNPYCLNAPFGAQCFPTKSFTLSVTSASCLNAPFGAQCFPTKPPACAYERRQKSQCTFWCSVLSDEKTLDEHMPVRPVSMHLLVLSAFRLLSMRGCMLGLSLNAPFGAQCFPTGNETLPLADQHGSQCTFWCSVLSDINLSSESRFFNWSQCTFWCSVLSDLKNTWRHVVFHIPSQCTFWCSVLSDIKNEIR